MEEHAGMTILAGRIASGEWTGTPPEAISDRAAVSISFASVEVAVAVPGGRVTLSFAELRAIIGSIARAVMAATKNGGKA